MTTLASVLAFLIALVGCGAARDFALRRRLVQEPNERSLHASPVPRLGGVAVVLAVLAASALLVALGPAAGSPPSRRGLTSWLVCAVPVALLGLIDDLRPLPVRLRLAVQIVVASGFSLLVDLPAHVLLAGGLAAALPAGVTLALGVVWIVGVLNLTNFMDGMDGLAGLQAVGFGVGAGSAFAAAGHQDLAGIAAVLGAANLGFFLHNAPPARIFMGDAGSTFLGFSFGALPILATARDAATPFLVGPVVLAPFLLDGTFTLVRRALSRERVWRAHRTHLYQRAVLSGLAHRDVLLRYGAWMGVSAGAASALPSLGPAPSLGLAALMATSVVPVVLWVRSAEHAEASRSRAGRSERPLGP